jgi:type I restriction enzyme S subunit
MREIQRARSEPREPDSGASWFDDHRNSKTTEVGVLPRDWIVAPLKDLVRQGPQNGYSGRTDDRARGTPTLSLAATSSGRLILNHLTVKYLSQSIAHDSPLFLKSGDVLVQRSNTSDLVGTTAVFNGTDGLFVYPDLMMRLRFKNQATAEWFWRYANSSRGRSFFRSASAGSTGTMPKISGQTLREMPVPCPSQAEQEAIAEALSDVDALIESLEQFLAKKRHLKQGAMQELLTGKKRLPGFEGQWRCATLSDCLLSHPDYGINAPGVPQSGDLPTYVRITDIGDDGRLLRSGRLAVQHPLAMNYLLNEHDLVVARTGASVGKAYRYNPQDGPLVFAGFLIRVRVNPGTLSPGFLAAFMQTETYWAWVRMMSMRSGQPGINGGEISGLELRLPPTVSEQTAIGAVLSDMDAEIAAVESKIAKAQLVKQGIMQELLTGRIRLV